MFPCTSQSRLRKWKAEALLVLAILDGSLPATLPVVSFSSSSSRAQGPCLSTGLLLLVDLLLPRIIQVIELARRLLHLISLQSLLRLSACPVNSCGVSVASRLPLDSVPTPEGLFTITTSLFFFHMFRTGRNINICAHSGKQETISATTFSRCTIGSHLGVSAPRRAMAPERSQHHYSVPMWARTARKCERRIDWTRRAQISGAICSPKFSVILLHISKVKVTTPGPRPSHATTQTVVCFWSDNDTPSLMWRTKTFRL